MADATLCADCRSPVVETMPRTPCARCGGTAIAHAVSISETVVSVARVLTRHRSPGGYKFRRQVEDGDSLFRKTGEFHKLHRKIDRDADRYRELIVDQAGNVLRDVDEPLSVHKSRK